MIDYLSREVKQRFNDVGDEIELEIIIILAIILQQHLFVRRTTLKP